MKNIVLIGFMGSGKTTVGKRIAAKLNIEFYDTDEAIFRCEKMPVYELLQKKGNKYFEGAQRFAVSTLVQNENCLISTGGDAVMDAFNLAELKKNGILFWLRASAETVYKNTRHSVSRRPGLANATPEDIDAMMKEREPYYSQADFVISVDRDDMDGVVDEIVKQYKQLKG